MYKRLLKVSNWGLKAVTVCNFVGDFCSRVLCSLSVCRGVGEVCHTLCYVIVSVQ